MFRGNQPPKRHVVRIRAATGQRTLTVRYVRLSGVRVVDVDEDTGTLRCVPGDRARVQVGEHAFAPGVLAGGEVTLSADGLSRWTRARFLRSAARAVGGDPVEVVLDGARAHLR